MGDTFYRKKTVLVTGHNGFVGSWLTLWLKEMGANVVGFSSNLPSNPCHYKLLGLSSRITDIKGDIRKKETVARLMRDYEPEIIIHLAARPILLDSYDNPIETYRTNVMGTLNMLESARKTGKTSAILNVTTDKVYENKHQRSGYTEEDKLGGRDPYSSSKACSELVTQTYRDSFLSDIGVATGRAGNVIGGGDWGKHRLVTDLVSSGFKHKKIIIKNPKSVRPWTYVLDILNGYLMLTEEIYKNPKKYSGAWNFASGYVKTVEDVVSEFSKYVEIYHKTNKSGMSKKKKLEEEMLLLDSTKSRKKLGWKPEFDFKETVKNTALWYNHFYRNPKASIFDYSKGQLSDTPYRYQIA